MSSDTGDRTWGHLASTEHFGRITDSSDYIQVDKENLENDPYYNSTQASHCMIFARNNVKTFGVYNPRAAVLVSAICLCILSRLCQALLYISRPLARPFD